MKIKIPIYQIIIVLLIVPLFYTIRNHFGIISMIKSVLPSWFISFSNNDYFVAAWLTIVILHWISLGLVILFLKINNLRLLDIGYLFNLTRSFLFVIGMISIGLLFYAIKTKTDFCLSGLISKQFKPVLFSQGEYLAWIFISINSGFCEEIVYRGFGINSIKILSVHRLLYLILPIISWITIHNLDNYGGFIQGIMFLGLNGLLFTGLYLWRRNLNLPIGFHAIANFFLILI